MTPDDPRHGTNAGHRAHFSAGTTPCQPCRDAHAEYRRNLWRKKYVRRVETLYVSTVGTTRRIRALQAIGWRLSDIDTVMGYAVRSNFTHNLIRQEQVHRNTAEKVIAAYEQLCMTPGPSERSRVFAERHGWAPPLAWDDIDDPDETPDGWQYTPGDRAADLVELDAFGFGVSEVCRRLNLRRDSLERWCDRHEMAEIFNRLVDRESTGYWHNQHAEGGVA